MKILIPVDGSACCMAALEFTASRPFAASVRPQIDLLNVQLPIPPRAGRAVGADFVRALHEAESSKILKPALALLRAAHLDPAWYYRVGSPAVEIVEWAEAHRTDLIIIGSHGHTALEAVVFGSVTQKVLASTTVPLLVIRAAKPPRRASLRVGIALDGSAYGTAAARYVLAHRQFFGPRPIVTLIHVAEPTARQAAETGLHRLAAERLSPAAAATIAGILAPVRVEFEQAGIAVHDHVLVGAPADEIARFARDRRLDLLAMGSHGRGAFTAAMLGSVASRVAATCRTPLLLLRLPAPRSSRS